ncbi:hypothetical protein CFP56_043317 [Quercus suber]|uniref:Uncharacterized protein n=1 Tax=Quercus suber TaxID=58331 RepID=A0AAW0LJC0_QUESU
MLVGNTSKVSSTITLKRTWIYTLVVSTSRKNSKLETESLAAKVTISTQETTPGQVFSNSVFTSSITSNPPTDRFGVVAYSACLFDVESSNVEALQP